MLLTLVGCMNKQLSTPTDTKGRSYELSNSHRFGALLCGIRLKCRGSAATEEKCKRLASASGDPKIALHTWNIYYRLSSPRRRAYNMTPAQDFFYCSLSNVCLCITTLLHMAEDIIVVGKGAERPHVGGK